ncbi:MAG: DUF4126 domain-containing protein, partial [Acidobacteriota bacterium]
MSVLHYVLPILLGLGLSASTGLNTFLPLLLLGAAARFHVAGITLGDKFEWLTSDAAMIALIIACVIELVADKIPAVDHFLDTAGTFVRPVAGALASASVLTGVDPMVAAIVGIIIGGPASLGMHTLKAGTRIASSATTFGCANPILSIVEDILSFSLSVVAIFLPILVPLALALLVFALWRIML